MAFTAPPTACMIQFSLSINISDTNTCSPGLPQISAELWAILPHSTTSLVAGKAYSYSYLSLKVLFSPKLAKNTQPMARASKNQPHKWVWQIHTLGSLRDLPTEVNWIWLSNIQGLTPNSSRNIRWQLDLLPRRKNGDLLGKTRRKYKVTLKIALKFLAWITNYWYCHQ